MTLYSLRVGWLRVLAARRRFMLAAKDASAHVVLLIGSPNAPMEHRESMLHEWRQLHPNSVRDVLAVRDTGSLSALLKKRAKLKRAIDQQTWLRTSWTCEGGCPRRRKRAVVEAREDGSALSEEETKERERILAKMSKLEAEIAKQLRERTADNSDMGRSFLVLFSSLREANAAQQLVHTEADAIIMRAPLPSDVRFKALEPRSLAISAAGRPAARVVYLLLLFFYSIPVAFISAVLQVPVLERHVPFLKDALKSLGPTISGFLTSFLPAVVLSYFSKLVPKICISLSKSEGWSSNSLVQKRGFEMLFLFKFIWNFLGVAIASGLFATISR